MSEPQQSEWNSVYYDGKVGQFITIDVGENEVTLHDYHNPESTVEMSFEEFEEEAEDYLPVPERAIETPMDLAQEALARCMEDGYEPVVGLHFVMETLGENQSSVADTLREDPRFRPNDEDVVNWAHIRESLELALDGADVPEAAQQYVLGTVDDALGNNADHLVCWDDLTASE